MIHQVDMLRFHMGADRMLGIEVKTKDVLDIHGLYIKFYEVCLKCLNKDFLLSMTATARLSLYVSKSLPFDL